MVNKFLIFATALATMIPFHSALAQETADWSGFFGGLHVGTSTATFATSEDQVFPVYNSFLSRVTKDVDGSLAGLHGGYHFQKDQFVFGFEADLGNMDISDDFLGLNAIDTRAIINTNGYATAKAKAGFSTGKVLLYVTAGYAWANATIGVVDTNGIQPSANTMDSRTDMDLDGAVMGVGVSYMTSNAWSMSVEYLQADFGDFTTSGAAGLGGTETWSHSLKIESIAFKVSRQF